MPCSHCVLTWAQCLVRNFGVICFVGLCLIYPHIKYRVGGSPSRLEQLTPAASVAFTAVTYDIPTGTAVSFTRGGGKVKLGFITRKLATESAFTMLEAALPVV